MIGEENIKQLQQRVNDINEFHNSSLPNYIPISFRGAGAFGYVIEAYDNKHDCRVAIKRTHKVGKKLSREYKVLAELKGCPNTVEMLDTFYSINDDGNIVQNIVFEYVSNSLENEIERLKENRSNFDYQKLRSIFSQILEGLVFVHKKNVVHRDLKPENVLYTSDNRVKICDFGSSKLIYKNEDFNPKVFSNFFREKYYNAGILTKSTPYIVSRYYRAPELILGCEKYGSTIDIFATGCIFFELASLTALFPGRAEGMQIFEQMLVLGDMPEGYLESFPSGRVLADTMKNLVVTKKLSIKDIISRNDKLTPEMAEDIADLVYKMICWWPHERITAEDALKHQFFTRHK